jgi:hypothetical protein
MLGVIGASRAGQLELAAAREEKLNKVAESLAELLGQLIMTSKKLRPPKRPG